MTLALGFRERRRTFAIAHALGARRGQLGAFVWSESAFVAIGGVVFGALLAVLMSGLLIRVLTGVFDPPPDAASVPWTYLAGVVALTLTAGIAAASATLRQLERSTIIELREL
jgi:putative ABC transport system permease protein